MAAAIDVGLDPSTPPPVLQLCVALSLLWWLVGWSSCDGAGWGGGSPFGRYSGGSPSPGGGFRPHRPWAHWRCRRQRRTRLETAGNDGTIFVESILRALLHLGLLMPVCAFASLDLGLLLVLLVDERRRPRVSGPFLVPFMDCPRTSLVVVVVLLRTIHPSY